VAEEHSSEGVADEDDSHDLNDMSSEDSHWAMLEDEQGRPGTDPEGKSYLPTLRSEIIA